MNQHEAPPLSLATIGHPGNNRVIFKDLNGVWRSINDGRPIDNEDFRGGWDLRELTPTEGRTEYEYTNAARDYGHEKAVLLLDENYLPPDTLTIPLKPGSGSGNSTFKFYRSK